MHGFSLSSAWTPTQVRHLNGKLELSKITVAGRWRTCLTSCHSVDVIGTCMIYCISIYPHVIRAWYSPPCRALTQVRQLNDKLELSKISVAGRDGRPAGVSLREYADMRRLVNFKDEQITDLMCVRRIRCNPNPHIYVQTLGAWKQNLLHILPAK